MIWGPRRGPLTPDEVRDAYPWPQGRRWIRAMMVTTLDGAAAGPDGLSGSISSGADRAVFDGVRRLADAVLVGAGTIRAERYGAMTAKEVDAEQRQAAAQRPAPIVAVVSPSLDLPWDAGVFTGSTERPLVLTVAEPDRDRLARAREHVEVVQAPGEDLAPEFLLDALTDRGLHRIVCEGGPRLLEDLSRAGLVDECDITLSPMLAGHGHVTRTEGLSEVRAFDLVHVLTSGGYLMTRSVRR